MVAILLFRSDKIWPRSESQSLLGTLHETRDPSFELNSPSVFASTPHQSAKKNLQSPIYIDNDNDNDGNDESEINILSYNEPDDGDYSEDSANWVLDPSEALSWNSPGEHGCYQEGHGGRGSLLRCSHTRDIDGVSAAFDDEDFYRFDVEGQVRRARKGILMQRAVRSADESPSTSRSRSEPHNIIKACTLTPQSNGSSNDDVYVEETQG